MAPQDKLITLITGGNSGIGKSLAGLLLEDPKRHVIITSRSVDKGAAAIKELETLGHPGTIEVLPLDIGVPSSIEALAKTIEEKHGRLDALVNNAAVGSRAQPASEFDKMQEAFKVNATGPYLLLTHLHPLLLLSPTTPRIINVSTGGGSITNVLNLRGWPFGPWPYPYFMSKAALNMLSGAWIASHREDNFKLFTYCPGFTESNLGPYNTREKGAKPTVDGARPMLPLLNGDRDEDHGKLVNSEGGFHPW